MRPIDVWNVETFDETLVEMLSAEADMIRAYMDRDVAIFRTYELATGPDRPLFRPANAHAAAFQALKERIMPLMAERTIRAWHYTRLTDMEADALRRFGVALSTPDSLRARLDALVEANEMSQETADAAFAASPFHGDQRRSRANKFWMVSHPVEIEDGGVEPLMARWGGEVASFWLKDTRQLSLLAQIGRRRVVELAVPLSATEHTYSAAEAVVAAFGRSIGCIPGSKASDLYTSTPLSGQAVVAVHTDGEPSFAMMARGYPAGFVDVSIGRREELTGQKD